MASRYTWHAMAVVAVLAAVAQGANSGRGDKPVPHPPYRPGPPVKAVTYDRAVAVRELTDFSREGLGHRFGPDYAACHAAAAGREAKFPDIYLAPTKEGSGNRSYQLGGPWTTQAGDFSSTQGQILYAPDQEGAMGVDRVTVLEMSNNCYSERPEPPWHGGFRPEPMSAEWRRSDGRPLGVPVAVARGMGPWANSGVIVFSSGFVASAGTCTAHGTNPTLELPAGKVP